MSSFKSAEDHCKEMSSKMRTSRQHILCSVTFIALICTLLLTLLASIASRRNVVVDWIKNEHDNDIDIDDTTQPLGSFRRRLSLFDMNNNCVSAPKVRKKKKEKEAEEQVTIPPTYLATYPGSGARVTRQLIKALTGLRIQNEFDDLARDNVIAIQTKFPHRSGALVSWDRQIHRSIILIRNPMYALPSFFDELYSSKKHLPAKFHPQEAVLIEDEASVGEWISWRDRMFESQMISYSEFIRYWTTRFDNQSRLILAYEDVMNDGTGSDEAKRIVEFLGMGGQVQTVEVEDAHCVWQTVVKNAMLGIDNDDEEDVQRERRRLMSENKNKMEGRRQNHHRRQLDSYIIPHPSSIEDAPASRLFTAEQLNVMATVLDQVAKELYTHSHYLNKLLVRYRAEVIEALKVQRDEEANLNVNNVVKPQRMEYSQFHIFSVSPPGTQSSVVTNWLMGLFEPEADVTTLVTRPGLAVYQYELKVPITTTIVTQTNEVNLIGLYKIYKPGFDEVFFVLSKSGTDADQQVNQEVCEYDNVLCIEHDEQLYNNGKELRKMVHHLTEKFSYRFAQFFGSNMIEMQEETAVARLQDMKSTIRAMKYESYEIVDPKFGVHGGLVEGEMTNVNSQGSDVATSNIATNNNNDSSPRRRLFYCGSTGSGGNINFSIMGIFLANAFFPEIVGSVPRSDQDDTSDTAIKLTQGSINDATEMDFLVFHMHQYCEVDVLTFPGQQLHINVSHCFAI